MIRKLQSSLTIKIFLITTGLLALACLLTYSVIAYFMPKTYSSDLNQQLEIRALELTDKLRETTLTSCGPLLDRFILDNRVSISIMDNNGEYIENLPTSFIITTTTVTKTDTVVTQSENRVSSAYRSADDNKIYYPQEDVSAAPYESYPTVAISSSQGAASTYGYPFTFADSTAPYTLLISTELREVNQVADALDRILPLVLLAILGTSLLGAIVYSCYITKPIVQLSAISRKFAALEFDWHCEESRRDEIGILGKSLNNLSSHLSDALSELKDANASLQSDIQRERAIEKQRVAFFSAASHELKTPITIIKGQLEGMLYQIGAYCNREKYLARALTVANQMENMVQELLILSRLDASGLHLQRTQLDFTALLRQQLVSYTELAEQRSITLHANLSRQKIINGNSAMLGKAFGCIISNAIRYSPPGAEVFVSLDGNTVTIENTQSQIPESDLPRIFEAFYRVEQSHSRSTGGSGLGLYLVQLILNQHNTQYYIENSENSVRFVVSFSEGKN